MEKSSSVKLFKLKAIVIIIVSLIIIDWYCEQRNINIIFKISTEEKTEESTDNDLHIGNFKLEVGDNE